MTSQNVPVTGHPFNDSSSGTALCAPTMNAVGGGAFISMTNGHAVVQSTYPNGGSPATGWSAAAEVTDDGGTLAAGTMTVYAVCG